MFTRKNIGDLIKRNITLNDDLKRLAEAQKDMANEVREIDRRLSRIEGRVDTIMEVAMLQKTKSLPVQDMDQIP